MECHWSWPDAPGGDRNGRPGELLLIVIGREARLVALSGDEQFSATLRRSPSGPVGVLGSTLTRVDFRAFLETQQGATYADSSG